MDSQISGTPNQNFSAEILKTITKADKNSFIKLLVQFNKVDDSTIHRALFEISTAKDSVSLFMLGELLGYENLKPWIKAEVIELTLDKAMMNNKFALLLINNSDEKTLIRATPVFANILITETDTQILFKVIKAVGKIREKAFINVIADFIFYDNNELKKAAVDALETIGGASALKRLAFAMTTSKADNQIAAAIKRIEQSLTLESGNITEKVKQFAGRSDKLEELDDDSDMAQLINMLNSNSPHDRHTAIDLLIETGVKSIPAVSANIDIDNPDSIINGLDILGNINNNAALPSVLKILKKNHHDSNVRFAACEAIAKLPPTDSITSLIKYLEDPVEQVRIAAAFAVNKDPSDIMIAGILSKIETVGRKSNQKTIIAAIIDSFSDKTFNSLMGSDTFVFTAGEYLSKASETTRKFFIDLLTKRGARSLATTIRDSASKVKKEKGISIYIVDDSEIMLNVYIKFFHNMGHRVKTFSDAENAIKNIEKRRPDLVISDLNMLKMNGLQMTKIIRKRFDSKKLPVVIITTQSDFVREHGKIGSIMPDGSISPDMETNLVLCKPPPVTSLKPLCSLIEVWKSIP